MQIQLNDDQMRAVMAKAILDQMTPEGRQTLLENAIKSLMTADQEVRGSYGTQRVSRLQQAFTDALDRYARTVIVEEFQKDDAIRAKVKELMIATAEKVLTQKQEEIAGSLADAFVKALNRDRY